MDENERKRAEQKARLISFLHKIPLFSDLPTSSARKILSVSSKIMVTAGDTVCKQGDESTSLYILLFGKLVVKIGDSPVATIEPVNSIGEMGVFTGEKRSATVEAVENSGLLCLRKSDLNALTRRDTDLGVRIMSKVVNILAKRIKDDNVKMHEYQRYVVSEEEAKEADRVADDIIDDLSDGEDETIIK